MKKLWISTNLICSKRLKAIISLWIEYYPGELSQNNKELLNDISAIPVIHKRSHLPIIADPSHAIGIRDKVLPMARAAVAAGADGIMIEVHNNPEIALSDGPQSLLPDQFSELMKQIKMIAEVIGRKI